MHLEELSLPNSAAAEGSWAGPAGLCAAQNLGSEPCQGLCSPCKAGLGFGAWPGLFWEGHEWCPVRDKLGQGCRAVGLSPPQEQSLREFCTSFKKQEVQETLSAGLFSSLKSFNFCFPRGRAWCCCLVSLRAAQSCCFVNQLNTATCRPLITSFEARQGDNGRTQGVYLSTTVLIHGINAGLAFSWNSLLPGVCFFPGHFS